MALLYYSFLPLDGLSQKIGINEWHNLGGTKFHLCTWQSKIKLAYPMWRFSSIKIYILAMYIHTTNYMNKVHLVHLVIIAEYRGSHIICSSGFPFNSHMFSKKSWIIYISWKIKHKLHSIFENPGPYFCQNISFSLKLTIITIWL